MQTGHKNQVRRKTPKIDPLIWALDDSDLLKFMDFMENMAQSLLICMGPLLTCPLGTLLSMLTPRARTEVVIVNLTSNLVGDSNPDLLTRNAMFTWQKNLSKTISQL